MGTISSPGGDLIVRAEAARDAPATDVAVPAGGRDLARLRPDPLTAGLRLMSELTSIQRLLPVGPSVMPVRRIGETELLPAAVELAESTVAPVAHHFTGLLPQLFDIDAAMDPAATSDDALAARLMTGVVDHVLGQVAEWSGRALWRQRPLALLLFGGPALEAHHLDALGRRLSKADCALARLVSCAAACGLTLFSDPFRQKLVTSLREEHWETLRQARLFAAAYAAPPLLSAPPPVPAAGPRWPWAAVVAIVAMAVLAQALIWEGMMVRIAALLLPVSS